MLEALVRDTMKGAAMAPAPIQPEWIEAGAPQARAAVIAFSDDRTTTAALWDCTAGRFTWRYSIDETIYFLEGETLISVDGGPAKRYGAGDSIHFSRGAVATWTVETYIRKVCFCRTVPPRPISLARRVLRGVARRVLGKGSQGVPLPAAA